MADGDIIHQQTFNLRACVKERPRMGGRRKVFTPEKTLDFEAAVRSMYNGPLLDPEQTVTVSIELDTDCFTVTIRESDRTRRKHLRGDVDNYIKAILDGLQSQKAKPATKTKPARTYTAGAFDDDKWVVGVEAKFGDLTQQLGLAA